MKTCSKCKLSKTLDSFAFRVTENRHQSYCKVCHSEYTKERWNKRKLDAIIYKGKFCEVCKTEYPYPAMQFHHRDPLEKDVDWGKLRLRSWSAITKELDKCALLCGNCHSIHHSNLGPLL